MSRKPWPIVILSILFFIIPLANLIGTYFALKLNVPFFSVYMESLLTIPENRWPVLCMILPSFAAGVAVYSVKRWSYPVFYSAMAFLTFQIFKNYSSHLATSNNLIILLVPLIFNMIYCFYFTLPSVRAVYYNPRLRWWETRPRYIYTSPARIIFNGDIEDVEISNIAEGGILANLPMKLEPQSTAMLCMVLNGTDIHMKVRVAYRKQDNISHGLQFVDLTTEQKRFMGKFMRKLEADKCELSRPVVVWHKDLIHWFTTLVKTGKGIVPS
ncbi:MAG: PilZ domain-containing protein [Bdellovibrionales bacterium]|nr:PilZ domain-containing protein [Bdellovibrionales bacterium]